MSDEVQVDPWLPFMGMTRVCSCPVALDLAVDRPNDVWTLYLTPSADCAPPPAPVPTPLSRPTSSVFGESVGACLCLTLPHGQMPGLGVDLGALPL